MAARSAWVAARSAWVAARTRMAHLGVVVDVSVIELLDGRELEQLAQQVGHERGGGRDDRLLQPELPRDGRGHHVGKKRGEAIPLGHIEGVERELVGGGGPHHEHRSLEEEGGDEKHAGDDEDTRDALGVLLDDEHADAGDARRHQLHEGGGRRPDGLHVDQVVARGQRRRRIQQQETNRRLPRRHVAR